ncbi:hypothetical protein BGZ46_000195 [Entomortierella lignicola]|nr:hypothetical protein BGZ46_000195 [Entomortierella lignicola]
MSDPTEKEISIPWPGKSAITVTLTIPPKSVAHSGFGLVLGPGAGGDEKTPLLTAVAKEVAKQGHFCARYRAKVPNLGFRVNLCTQVMEHLFHPTSGVYPLKACFLGGHSMGTRVAGTIAANVASKISEPTKKPTAKGKRATATTKAKESDSTTTSDFPQDFISGLILYSYPLHTPDNTKALRDQILYDIPNSTPTLFVSGLKDTMCQLTLFDKVFKDMKASRREVVRVQDADHGLGFGSSKPGQAKKEALIESICEWTVAFMDEAIVAKTDTDNNTTTGTTSAKSKNQKSIDIATKKKAELKKIGEEWTVALSTVA